MNPKQNKPKRADFINKEICLIMNATKDLYISFMNKRRKHNQSKPLKSESPTLAI